MGEDQHSRDTSGIETGDFPFPLTRGPDESRYLTWLRNHSNYMVTNGFTDVLRIIAVMARGIFLNFLILLPYFLLIGAAMALAHLSMSHPSRVDFTFASPTQAVLAPDSQVTEVLTVEISSNFGETDRIILDFDRSAEDIAGSMDRLLIQLWDATGQFAAIDWTYSDQAITGAIPARDTQITVTTKDLTTHDALHRDFRSRSPMAFSGLLLLIAAVLAAGYPIAIRMSRVRRYQTAQRTGHFSSVQRRDWYERFFGALLLVMILAALAESFPILTAYFHSVRQGDIDLAVPTLAGLAGVLVTANRLLPNLKGLPRTVAMLIFGLIGVAIPLVVILYVVEFLVYVDKSQIEATDWHRRIAYVLMVPLGIFAGLLFATWVIGARSFRPRGHAQVLGLCAVMLGLMALVPWGAGIFHGAYPIFLYVYYTCVIAAEIWIYCWLAVDVNQTSINGLYRDRLATAYLIGADRDGDVDIEQDINLAEICNYDAGSTAPYHLINVALNLQNSKDISLRDRKSDFFMFSKRFIGGTRTGYCRAENMEAAFPMMDLGTAMAISAAAAAPNMGRNTKPLMTSFLTLLNIRLGFWVPHPDRLERYLADRGYIKEADKYLSFDRQVFCTEISEISKRRLHAYDTPRPLAPTLKPTVDHQMVGLAFSGGGIRSATLNLGIAQELHRRGVFTHVDYMSSVSGGGYLAASLSALMRHRTSPYALTDGTVAKPDTTQPMVQILCGDTAQDHEFAPWAKLNPALQTGTQVRAGQMLLQQPGRTGQRRFVSLMDAFSWRVRPGALRREILSDLDETHDWVNLSDGGHLENLATIELLRRRCKIIIIGDGEGDPDLQFHGLATLIRTAQIDLGIEININVDPIRHGTTGASGAHFAIGHITYPEKPEYGLDQQETGVLLYLKSSLTGDEGPVIKEYHDRKPEFPHESTADQLFDEGQFEAYRALGEHIARTTLAQGRPGDDPIGYADLWQWLSAAPETLADPQDTSDAAPGAVKQATPTPEPSNAG